MNADGSHQHLLTRNHNINMAPDWSPDGQRLVYTRTQGNSQICISSADGSNPRYLTFDRDNEYDEPAWSPDGRRIACWEIPNAGLDNEGVQALYVMNADGTNPQKLWAENRHNDYDRGAPLAWNPQGSAILLPDLTTIALYGHSARLPARSKLAGLTPLSPDWSRHTNPHS